MIKKLLSTMALAAMLVNTGCSGSGNKAAAESDSTSESCYSNPIIGHDGPDPTIIRDKDGTFWLYNTANLLSIWKSDDMVEWEHVGSAFNEETRPDEVRYNYGKAALWAPEIRVIKDKYVLFFSMWWGDDGTYDGHAFAYATADAPQGPFTFRGIICSSDEKYPPYYQTGHSIDQFYVEDNGKPYIFWGSFRGLYAAELDINDNLDISIIPESIHKVGGTAYEGSCVYKRGNYYYLFASVGDWTGGMNSTYRTVVGRSDNLFGPYTNRKGEKMLDNKFEEIIAGDERFAGTGHNSNIIADDAGNTWFFYHAYDSLAPEKGRQTMMDRIDWSEDGWPTVANGHPTDTASAPTIVKKQI